MTDPYHVEYDTLEELVEAIKTGDVDREDVTLWIDNDHVNAPKIVDGEDHGYYYKADKLPRAVLEEALDVLNLQHTRV